MKEKKKLELKKVSFDLLTNDELEKLGGKPESKKCPANTTCEQCDTACDVTCTESYCYCDS